MKEMSIYSVYICVTDGDLMTFDDGIIIAV